MFKLMGKKLITILRKINLLNWPFAFECVETISVVCFQMKSWILKANSVSAISLILVTIDKMVTMATDKS